MKITFEKRENTLKRYIDYQWFTMYSERVFSQIFFFI